MCRKFIDAGERRGALPVLEASSARVPLGNSLPLALEQARRDGAADADEHQPADDLTTASGHGADPGAKLQGPTARTVTRHVPATLLFHRFSTRAAIARR